jgi:hypothetical protein
LIAPCRRSTSDLKDARQDKTGAGILAAIAAIKN